MELTLIDGKSRREQRDGIMKMCYLISRRAKTTNWERTIIEVLMDHWR